MESSGQAVFKTVPGFAYRATFEGDIDGFRPLKVLLATTVFTWIHFVNYCSSLNCSLTHLHTLNMNCCCLASSCCCELVLVGCLQRSDGWLSSWLPERAAAVTSTLQICTFYLEHIQYFINNNLNR